MDKEVIDVSFYGGKSIFGGREKPLVAKITSCDRHNECSYYKEGQCMAITSPFSGNCKFGSKEDVRGYTSRAKKYRQFRDKWENHEQYNKLERAKNKLGLIGDTVVFPYAHVELRGSSEGKYKPISPTSMFGKEMFYINIDDFTVDLIRDICNFRPQAIMGGEIRSYQKEVVPRFISHLKEVLPGKYEEFIKTYPEFDKEIDYIGRKALLKTINPSYVHYKSRNYPNLNSDWYWDGEQLKYVSGYVSSFSVAKNYDIGEISLVPTDKTVVKIEDNKQVNSDTVFLD